MEEVENWTSAKELQVLFANLLLLCDVADPIKLWEDHRCIMSDNVSHRVRSVVSYHEVFVSNYNLQQHVLLELGNLLNSCSTSNSLSDFNLPLPKMSVITTISNQLILEERSYDAQKLYVEYIT